MERDAFVLIMRLLRYSCPEFREIILNSIFNQIRYPNKISFFYLNFIFMQFAENEIIQIIEQV